MEKLNKTDKNPVPWDLLGISLAFSSEMGYTSSRRAMQSKFMCVKCLSDGELPKDEKRNLAVRELLLAATEDKQIKIISYCVRKSKKEVIFLWEKKGTCFSTQPKS